MHSFASLPHRLYAGAAKVLFCGGVFVAEQTVGRFVFLDGRKTAHSRIEPIVIRIVITLRYFAQKNGAGAGLYLKNIA